MSQPKSRLPFYLVSSIGAPRDHQALFLLIDQAKGEGRLWHVTGNIQEGMKFESRDPEIPSSNPEFVGKEQIGWVYDTQEDICKIDEICQGNPPPEKQFDGPRRLDKTKKLRRCQEWVAETVDILKADGVLMPL